MKSDRFVQLLSVIARLLNNNIHFEINIIHNNHIFSYYYFTLITKRLLQTLSEYCSFTNSFVDRRLHRYRMGRLQGKKPILKAVRKRILAHRRSDIERDVAIDCCCWWWWQQWLLVVAVMAVMAEDEVQLCKWLFIARIMYIYIARPCRQWLNNSLLFGVGRKWNAAIEHFLPGIVSPNSWLRVRRTRADFHHLQFIW